MLKLDESQLSLERALALEPNNAETLNNLANTLKRLGLAAEAEKRWNAALALEPDYAEAYSNLSNLLIDQGEYDRAEGVARRAIELNPRLADAYINLAAVATARHRHADALMTLDALIAFTPAHPRALAARALALKELDRLEEALDAARRAALAAPESPEPHNAMGQAYQAMGQFEPALAAYDRAAVLPGPAQQDAIANRGALFMEFGRKEEAMKALEEAARAFPHAPGILFSQTDLKRFEAGDPLIAQMQALLRARDFRSPTARRCISAWARPTSTSATLPKPSAIITRATGSSARPSLTTPTGTTAGWPRSPKSFRPLS